MAGTSNRYTRGRRSAEARTAIQAGPGAQRPDPPAAFSEVEAAIWRKIADACPPNFITDECQHLLARLCTLIACSEQMEIELRASGFRFSDKKDAVAYCDITKQIAALTTKLRLSPQSRYTRFEASSRMRNCASPRLWETDDEP